MNDARSPRRARNQGLRRRLLRTPGLAALALLAVLGTACSPPDDGAEADQDAVADEGPADMPGGYDVRLDSQGGDPGQFVVQEDAMGDAALRVTTGPAGIGWRDEDAVDEGPFRARAAFVQHDAPVGYREAYGIFVGGRELDTDDQEYTYLLVRSTGEFLVKRRLGEATETLVGWTTHPAVAQVLEDGDRPRNVLAVEATADETRFLVNDAVVHRMPTAEAAPYGIAGIRVNHRLDVVVEEWTVEPLADGATDPS